LRNPQPGKTPRGVRVIEVSALLAIVLGTTAIATRQPGHPVQDGAAVGLAAGSLGLFLWAARTVRRTPLTHAFSDDRPVFLITNGPFRLNRNPFYTAYLLAHGYAVVASGNLWLLLVLAWMTALYVAAVRKEEWKLLNSPLREEYERYRQRTGRFLPRPWPLRTAPVAAEAVPANVVTNG
jgi:protein-S-isoprenylcysteine O-methyltransferase Ste14